MCVIIVLFRNGGLFMDINLDMIQAKKKQLEELKAELNNKRKAFEQNLLDQRLLFDESLQPLEESISETSQEYDDLCEQTVSVPLGDLVYELSRLTGTPVSEMGISVLSNVACWGKYSKEELVARTHIGFMNNPERAYEGKPKLEITIQEYKDSVGKDNAFYFRIFFDLDFKDIQKDGKTLLEHCNIRHKYDYDAGMNYTCLIFNRNIEDILCVIRLKDLVEDTHYYRPTGLLRKAVLNCLAQEEKVKRLQK